MPIIQNVFTKVSYFENGLQKSRWYRVGDLKTTERGRKYLRLFHQPDMTFYVMDNLEKPEDLGSLPVIT